MVVLGGLFLYPAGLATALVLIPFLLLYLIRPKPQRAPVPSLLFLMRDRGKGNINSLFRTLFRDLLLVLQLLLFLALILAAAKPYIDVPRTYLVEQTVIVLDVSGSMQADGRFDQAISLAKENLGKENTIILLQQNPRVLVERVSSSRAKAALGTVKPTATTTALTDALQLAGSYAGTGTRVVVISDFSATQGDLDYETATAALEGRGAIVDYLPVTGGSHNVGIIDLIVGPSTSSVWLKNYDARPEQVTLDISDAKQQVLLAKGETKEITFTTPPGVAELKIEEKDDLMLDNEAWTSTPEKNSIKLLAITNHRGIVQRSNLLLAMSIIQQNFPTSFDVEYAQPPKMPTLDHDVYLVNQASLNFILPGYVKDLKEKVNQGAGLVVIVQPDLFSLDWNDLLPVAPAQDLQGGRASIVPAAASGLTADIEFGQTASYLRVTAKDDATVVAKTETGDPLIVLRRQGRGVVLYYGLDDAKASFSKDPSYAVFWRRAFDLLTDRPSLANLNVRTGSLIALTKKTTVKTPKGTVTGDLLSLDWAGLYVLPDRTIAANTLSDKEGDLSVPNVTREQTDVNEKGTEKAPLELTNGFLWTAIALLLLEILYIKYRGDL